MTTPDIYSMRVSSITVCPRASICRSIETGDHRSAQIRAIRMACAGVGEVPIVPPPAALANADLSASGRDEHHCPCHRRGILEVWMEKNPRRPSGRQVELGLCGSSEEIV